MPVGQIETTVVAQQALKVEQHYQNIFMVLNIIERAGIARTKFD